MEVGWGFACGEDSDRVRSEVEVEGTDEALGEPVAGEVDMDVNFALEDYEVARGFVLTCQSYPVTDKVTVDYDQSG